MAADDAVGIEQGNSQNLDSIRIHFPPVIACGHFLEECFHSYRAADLGRMRPAQQHDQSRGLRGAYSQPGDAIAAVAQAKAEPFHVAGALEPIVQPVVTRGVVDFLPADPALSGR